MLMNEGQQVQGKHIIFLQVNGYDRSEG